MKARKKLAVTLALLLMTSGSAFALGLGQIKVKSALDQPLQAVIPVVSATPAELRGLKVTLASSEDFQRAGISRERIQTPLDFKVEKRDGQTVIVVSSKQPINDPALDLLLELNWSNGKLLREFSILLDPVGMPAARATAAPAVTAAATEKKPAATRPTRRSAAAAPTARTATTASAAPRTSPDIEAGSSYTVRSGDNVWSIAQRSTRSAGEINRMMVAIQNANPDAFYKDNINALKKGAVLRIPERSAMAQVSAGEARDEVRRQNQVWSNPGAASPSMMAGTSPGSNTAPRTGSTASGSRLELVPPKSGTSSGTGRSGVAGGSGDAAVAGLKQDLARAKEALASEKQRSGDMAARVKDLEGIRDNNKRLLKLKDARIAELQAALDKANSAKPAAAGTAPALQKDIFAPAEAGSAATAAVPGTAGAAEASSVAETAELASAATAPAPAGSVAMAPADTASAAPAASTEMAADAAVPAATVQSPATEPESKPQQVAPAPVTVSEPWYMQTWAWIVGGLIILGLLLLALVKRRGGAGDTRSDRLSDALASGDGELGHEDLGEDSEDEYALLEEIEQHPEELSLHLELASLYYAHRNEAKFEGAAEAMYAQVDDPSQPEWQQVRAMGEELCPDHPLFAELHTDGGAVETGESELADLVGEHEDSHVDDADKGQSASGYNFDFDLTPAGGGSGQASPDTAEEDEDLLSLSSLAGVGPDEEADESSRDEEFDTDTALGAADLDDSARDDYQADEPAAPADDTPVAEHAPEDEAPADDAAEQEFSSDPVDTKLDLARAYQDMGDEEGARAMLEEVLQEGSTAQKDAAQKLLDDLG